MSVGQVVGGIVGGVIGFVVTGGNPYGAFQGFMAGSAIGGGFTPGSLPTVEGPRLQDLRAQSSEYGRPIAIVYGTAGISGNVIEAFDLIEVKTETEQGGGFSQPSQTTRTYAYYADFAVLLSEPVESVLRIWAGPDKRLIYDGVTLEGGGTISIYTGTETQLPDPLLESYHGVGNVPAYRGSAYIVFGNFPVAKDGNMIPFLTIEVGAGGQICPVAASTVFLDGFQRSVFDPAPIKIADITPPLISQYAAVFSDAATGMIYFAYADNFPEPTWFLGYVDPKTGVLGTPISLNTNIKPSFAWDNQGTAVAALPGTPSAIYIDLFTHEYSVSTPLSGRLTNPNTGVYISAAVPVEDVAWSEEKGMFVFLSLENQYNGYIDDLLVIDQVDSVLGIARLPYLAQWGAYGARFGGSLLTLRGSTSALAAASFISQPSNFVAGATTEGVTWQAFDSRRQIVVDFNSGSYANLNTGEFVQNLNWDVLSLPEGVQYSAAQDMFYVASSGGIYMYDPEKLTPDGWPPEDCVIYQPVAQAYAGGLEAIPVDYRMQLFILPNEPDYLGVLTGGGDIMKINIRRNLRQSVSLASVVADLSGRAGLTPDQIDVTALTDMVDGYVIAKQTTARAAIDALRPAYYFDAVESGGVVKFVKRDGDIVAVISDDDLAAHLHGDQAPEPLLTTRQMDVELPRTVNVNYLSAATDYATATRTSARLIGNSGLESTLDFPLVLSDTKAQEIAVVNLYVPWLQRLSYAFTLPRKYSYLEPTDPIIVKGHTMRLGKITATARGLLQCEAVEDDADHYAPNVIVTETVQIDKTVFIPGATRLELM